MDAFLAMIAMFGMNWIPRFWAGCWGQSMDISNNAALYSLLGLTYGGDGRLTFKLPDLRGRVPMGTGQGPGIPRCDCGGMYGFWQRNIMAQHLPSHSHLVDIPAPSLTVTFKASDKPGTETTPGANDANVLAAPVSRFETKLYNKEDANVALAGGSVESSSGPQTVSTSATGQGAAFEVVQPSLGVSFGICTQGIFPHRQ